MRESIMRSYTVGSWIWTNSSRADSYSSMSTRQVAVMRWTESPPSIPFRIL